LNEKSAQIAFNFAERLNRDDWGLIMAALWNRTGHYTLCSEKKHHLVFLL